MTPLEHSMLPLIVQSSSHLVKTHQGNRDNCRLGLSCEDGHVVSGQSRNKRRITSRPLGSDSRKARPIFVTTAFIQHDKHSPKFRQTCRGKSHVNWTAHLCVTAQPELGYTAHELWWSLTCSRNLRLVARHENVSERLMELPSKVSMTGFSFSTCFRWYGVSFSLSEGFLKSCVQE